MIRTGTLEKARAERRLEVLVLQFPS